jgi:ubiquitin-activating enzyme E1
VTFQDFCQQFLAIGPEINQEAAEIPKNRMEHDLTKNAAFMDLYSRQIGAFGIETMGKLINMRVIVVGLKGVGVEIAKNLILAGPGAVILCDDGLTEVIYSSSLGFDFFPLLL